VMLETAAACIYLNTYIYINTDDTTKRWHSHDRQTTGEFAGDAPWEPLAQMLLTVHPSVHVSVVHLRMLDSAVATTCPTCVTWRACAKAQSTDDTQQIRKTQM
jgi:hypothetical protein